MIKNLSLVLLTLLPTIHLMAGELSISVGLDGVTILSDAGKYVLNVPNLSLKEDDYEGQKPELAMKDDVLIAKYAQGLEIEITTDKKASVTYTLSDPAPKAKGLRFGMVIPTSIGKEGGKFAFDSAASKEFPVTKDQQYLFTGNAQKFSLLKEGKGFALTSPVVGWQGLQDNRVFKWDVFQYQFLYDFQSQAVVKIMLSPINP